MFVMRSFPRRLNQQDELQQAASDRNRAGDDVLTGLHAGAEFAVTGHLQGIAGLNRAVEDIRFVDNRVGREAPYRFSAAGFFTPLTEPDVHLSMYPALQRGKSHGQSQRFSPTIVKPERGRATSREGCKPSISSFHPFDILVPRHK